MLLFRRLAPARVAASQVSIWPLSARYNGGNPSEPETFAHNTSLSTSSPRPWSTGPTNAEDAPVQALARGRHSFTSIPNFHSDRRNLEVQPRLGGLERERKDRQFTSAEDEVLFEMRKQDYQYSIIARKLNRTIGGLRNRMMRLKRNEKTSEVDELDDIDSDAALESSSAQHKSTIKAIRAGTPWTAQDDAKLLEMRKRGQNVAFIAVTLGRSARSVRERQQWVLRPGRRSSLTPLDLVDAGRGSQPRFSETEKMAVVYHRRCLAWKWVDIARLLPGRKPRVIQSMYLRHWRDAFASIDDDALHGAVADGGEATRQASSRPSEPVSSSFGRRSFSTVSRNKGCSTCASQTSPPEYHSADCLVQPAKSSRCNCPESDWSSACHLVV